MKLNDYGILVYVPSRHFRYPDEYDLMLAHVKKLSKLGDLSLIVYKHGCVISTMTDRAVHFHKPNYLQISIRNAVNNWAEHSATKGV